jgi:hypothetical protein
LSWYQGDFNSDEDGLASETFAGRFQQGTFILAPGAAPAPQVFADDAKQNPATNPVQIYHLGIWFSWPEDAKNAGCADTQTPFTSNPRAFVQPQPSWFLMPSGRRGGHAAPSFL